MRTTARAQQRGEFDEIEARRDALIAGLATDRAFYCAANDDGRRRAAAAYDAQFGRFLDPAARNDRTNYNAGYTYSIALSIVRAAADAARTETRPRLVAEAHRDLPAYVVQLDEQLPTGATKDQRRRAARAVLEEALGFSTGDLVDALVVASSEAR